MKRVVKIGKLEIGGNNPVRIKGMLKSSVSDTKALIKEAKRLEKEGAEAIRVAVQENKDAKLANLLSKHVKVPLVADIHFCPQIALAAIEQGFNSIRLNPLNIYKKNDLKKIAKAAKDKGVSIRVGVNSGGFKKDFSSPEGLARQMVKKVQDYLKILESQGFFDIMVSLKGADVIATIVANRMFSKESDYPLHLGVTATGPFLEGIVKSSIGLGSLLNQGIGDVIRVSLAGPSFQEVRIAKYILQALNLRKFGPEIISCPTCSRCEVNIAGIVGKLKKKLENSKINKPLRVAVMGCIVNGPGEAYQADIGAAFGKKKAVIFKKDKILGYSSEEKIIENLVDLIKK
ncbi:MAG: flavodoxin-dependent (E)-4-hydroxy-3-methylbut-2-enyl-diphosphate synthase [Candidatus Omnitrophota bacterium]